MAVHVRYKPLCISLSFAVKQEPEVWPNNNYSMSPSWIWSDKITNERVARVGYNHFISNKGEWNNCFSKFSNRVLPPIFISTILQSVRKENLAHYFPYDVKLRLLAHSRSFLANQKARNAIVGAENLLNPNYALSEEPERRWLIFRIFIWNWALGHCILNFSTFLEPLAYWTDQDNSEFRW